MINLFIIAAIYGFLGQPSTGVGAYYQPGIMQAVCERRVNEGWNPQLDCSWPCLISSIYAEDMGKWAVVAIPGGGLHLCQAVDCGQEEHMADLLKRGEVVEVVYSTTTAAVAPTSTRHTCQHSNHVYVGGIDESKTRIRV